MRMRKESIKELAAMIDNKLPNSRFDKFFVE